MPASGEGLAGCNRVLLGPADHTLPCGRCQPLLAVFASALCSSCSKASGIMHTIIQVVSGGA
jgi:hypothetical protein